MSDFSHGQTMKAYIKMSKRGVNFPDHLGRRKGIPCCITVSPAMWVTGNMASNMSLEKKTHLWELPLAGRTRATGPQPCMEWPPFPASGKAPTKCKGDKTSWRQKPQGVWRSPSQIPLTQYLAPDPAVPYGHALLGGVCWALVRCLNCPSSNHNLRPLQMSRSLRHALQFLPRFLKSLTHNGKIFPKIPQMIK